MKLCLVSFASSEAGSRTRGVLDKSLVQLEMLYVLHRRPAVQSPAAFSNASGMRGRVQGMAMAIPCSACQIVCTAANYSFFLSLEEISSLQCDRLDTQLKAYAWLPGMEMPEAELIMIRGSHVPRVHACYALHAHAVAL